MDYVIEAKKFVQRANEADHPEVIKEHLKMADWCRSRRSTSGKRAAERSASQIELKRGPYPDPRRGLGRDQRFSVSASW